MMSYGPNISSAFSDVSAVSYGTMFDVRVDGVQLVLRRRQLRTADVRRAVKNLALQVAEIHDVEVDDAERADAGSREIQRGGRSQPARADAQHPGGLQLALPLHADLGHDQMPAVPLDLFVGELGQLTFGQGPAKAGHYLC